MNRLIASVIGGALLAGSVGLMIANAQQASGPAFIAGDRPVTAEQVREKLQTDGWSNVVISRNGKAALLAAAWSEAVIPQLQYGSI